MNVIFSVPFVRGKQRPRFSNGHAYTPRQTRSLEAEIRAAYAAAGGGKAPKGAEVSLYVTTVRVLPKTFPKRIEKWPDTTRPDIDNILKLVMDALNGTAWHDDAQVTRIFAGKCPRRRGVTPETCIRVVWEEAE